MNFALCAVVWPAHLPLKLRIYFSKILILKITSPKLFTNTSLNLTWSKIYDKSCRRTPKYNMWVGEYGPLHKKVQVRLSTD